MKSSTRHEVTPIGRVHSPLCDPDQAPKQGFEGAPDARVQIESGFLAALEGIEAGQACRTGQRQPQRAGFAVDPEHQILAADLNVNLTPLIGNPMSCLPPAGSGLKITETGDSVTLWFTPGAYDCGLTGIARRAGDSLSGTWEDESIAGPVNRGRFWMRRGAP
jgi:hypothetical protein